MRAVFAVLLFVVVSIAACSTPTPSPVDAGAAIGRTCRSDSDCASGVCLDSDDVCTAACTTDADCPFAAGGVRLVCGVAECDTGGCAMCVPPCGAAHYTCVAGVSTDCTVAADDSLCLDCGCADPTMHCVRGVGCAPPAPVGDPCRLDRDCESGSCSTFAGVCRVPVGSPCSAADCDACLHLPSGATHCSRECRTAAECNGDPCTGSAALLFYECTPSVCAGDACTVERAPHEAGQTCREDSDCSSGGCFSAMRCSGSECVGEGWCSAPCTAEADCAEGTHCVTIPCATGQTVACGDVCLHACEGFVDCGVYGGVCTGLETPARTIEMVCDVRRDAGRTCMDDRECLSASCVSGGCT
jgi:hypothetical protein